MKRLFFIGLATMSIGSATLTSCGKYTEGPGFALTSKKARLSGEWVLSTKTVNSVDVIQAGFSESLIISKDGSFQDTAKISYNGFNYVGGITGTWGFSDDKMQLILTAKTANTSFIQGANTLDIVKLTADELILTKTGSNNSVTRMTYIPKN